MILVTGATGHVGVELVSQLSAQHQRARAMTRRPDAAHMPPGIEAVYGDADEPASLDRAFAGVSRAFLMSAQWLDKAERPTHDLALVEAARRAGVSHIVKLSVYSGGAGDDVIAAWHREAEQAVTASGTGWTLLRPGRFMSNALHWAPMIRRSDRVHVPFAQRAAASIDPADIAAVALMALTTGAHRNAALQLSGPQALTPAQELRTLAETLGRPLQLLEPTIEEAKSGMVAAGMPAPVVDAVVARVLEGKEGTAVLPTVEQILGRPPMSFEDWATRHAGVFARADGA